MFPMIVNLRSGIDCGKVIEDALNAEQMTHKEAWIGAGYHNGAEWSRAIQGTRPLDLHKIAALPFKFQCSFIAKYGAAQVLRYVRGYAADRLRMARAELRQPVNERKVG